MKNKIVFLGLVVLFIIGCAQEQAIQEKKPAVITEDKSSSIGEKEDTVPQETEDPIEEEVKDLLEEGKDVKSISYNYKGPETNNFYYEFYVKGDKVKYLPERELKSLDREDSYNSIYLDKAESTAEAYCDARQCVHKGKKADLRYVEYDISTPFDWLDKITSAEKVSEELIGSRKTWKINANDNIELWIDTFYGVPLQVVQNSNKYEFSKMVLNNLKDSDVVPG